MQNPLPVAPALLNAFTQGILSQRQWMHDNFPESESILAIDILVNVANNTLSNNPTPMKDLLGSIPFSEVGIRKQVTRLKKNRLAAYRPFGPGSKNSGFGCGGQTACDAAKIRGTVRAD